MYEGLVQRCFEYVKLTSDVTPPFFHAKHHQPNSPPHEHIFSQRKFLQIRKTDTSPTIISNRPTTTIPRNSQQHHRRPPHPTTPLHPERCKPCPTPANKASKRSTAHPKTSSKSKYLSSPPLPSSPPPLCPSPPNPTTTNPPLNRFATPKPTAHHAPCTRTTRSYAEPTSPPSS